MVLKEWRGSLEIQIYIHMVYEWPLLSKSKYDWIFLKVCFKKLPINAATICGHFLVVCGKDDFSILRWIQH